MFASLLIIVHLLASDVQLPFGLNDGLIAATAQFAPDPSPLAAVSQSQPRIPVPSLPPLARSDAPELAVTARRAVLIDAESASVLLAKNADEKTQPASIAKLMTALVVLDRAESLDQVLEVPKEIRELEEASSVAGFSVGERVTVGNLLSALLIASANDAAITLADGLAGSEKEFVKEMNQRAEMLGLADTHFDNSTGLDSAGNRSTARDLAFLLLHAQRNSLIRELTTSGATSIASEDGNTYYLKPTDQLLAVTTLEIRAGKTGTTDLAGQNFVVMAEQDGHRLIAVLLDSQDRFPEAEALLSYGFEAFTWDASADTRVADEDADKVAPYGG